MSVAAFLEILETEEGEVVLRRTDSTPGNSEPLVAIRFSPEVRSLLGDNLSQVANAMIGAGVQMTTQLQAGVTVVDDEPRLLH
ncbi:MAG TPA: hypothetical protein VF050_11955 [Moraxellaceae bacterium]